MGGLVDASSPEIGIKHSVTKQRENRCRHEFSMMPSERLPSAAFGPAAAHEPRADLEILIGKWRKIVGQTEVVAELLRIGGALRKLVPRYGVAVVYDRDLRPDRELTWVLRASGDRDRQAPVCHI